VIGANPTENHPVAATFFKQAAKRGAKLIVMDPRGQHNGSKANRETYRLCWLCGAPFVAFLC
jgi:predicted molibdopterin-dependent oxidoreductase YjgC